MFTMLYILYTLSMSFAACLYCFAKVTKIPGCYHCLVLHMVLFHHNVSLSLSSELSLFVDNLRAAVHRLPFPRKERLCNVIESTTAKPWKCSQ